MKRLLYIAEWEPANHEVLLIRKAFQGLLSITQVDYELRMHHELTGRPRNQMEANIQQMLQFNIESRENPYLSGGEVRLHTILTNECVPASNTKKRYSSF